MNHILGYLVIGLIMPIAGVIIFSLMGIVAEIEDIQRIAFIGFIVGVVLDVLFFTIFGLIILSSVLLK